MSTVEEIKRAIGKLTLEERADVARYLNEWEDDSWDKQMQRDAESGKLDALIANARKRIKSGHTQDML